MSASKIKLSADVILRHRSKDSAPGTVDSTQSAVYARDSSALRFLSARLQRIVNKRIEFLNLFDAKNFFQFHRTDLPANELVQRHKIASCGSSSSISNPQNSVSPNWKNGDCNFESSSNGRINSINSTSSVNLSLNQISPYRRSLSHTPSINSTLAFDEKR